MTADSGVDEVDHPALDATFDALADETRRLLLYFLREHDTASLDLLADVLAGWVATREDRTGTPSDRDRLYAQLYHQHVPKLAAAELVAFDTDAGTVRLAALPDPLSRLLDEAYALESARATEALAAFERES